MVMAEMPKFFGQMQNITVNNGTSKVTFTCALSGSIVGVHKVYYSSSSLNGNPSNGNNPLYGNFFNLPNGLLHKTRGFWKLFLQ